AVTPSKARFRVEPTSSMVAAPSNRSTGQAEIRAPAKLADGLPGRDVAVRLRHVEGTLRPALHGKQCRIGGRVDMQRRIGGAVRPCAGSVEMAVAQHDASQRRGVENL